MTASTMFSREEALEFLQTSWHLADVEKRLAEEPHDLLNDIVVAVQAQLPFQNVTLMATPASQRRRPSLDDVKRDCVEGRGGLCYTLNLFTWGLLGALGYHVTLCHATCTATTKRDDNHVFLLLRHLRRPDDLHLVETGVGFPTFRAVPLDFGEGEESAVYRDSFLEYKYIRQGGLLLRMHGKGDNAPRPEPPRPEIDYYVGPWRRFYYSDLVPVSDLSDFEACFDVVYADPRASSFHHSPRALSFPDRQAVIISANRLTSEKDGCDVTVDPANEEAILELYRIYFPRLSEKEVREAYREWRRVNKK